MADIIETKDLRAYHFGEFRLDLIDETLWRNDRKLNINHRMFQVLLLLIERKGRVVAKEVFFQEVWSGSFVEDNNLTVTIAALRKVLEDNAKQAQFIENLPRKGYRFVAPVEIEHGPVENLSSALGSPNETPSPKPGSRPRSFIYGSAMIGVLLILSIAGLSFKTFWLPKATPQGMESVAVLPFETKLGKDEYLAEGMTDGISTALSKIPSLRVINRNSTSHYKDPNADAASAGRDLRVDGLITGHIEPGPETPMVTVELTNVANNSKIWQQQFRLPQGETLSVQQEIIRLIAQNLNRSSEQISTAKPPTDDPDAYDLYIQGRYYWDKRTNDDIVRSAQLFQAAIDKDSKFARAYIGLADAYALGDFRSIGIPTEKRTALAKTYVRKALELDDTLGEGYAVLAIGQCYSEWDFVSAEQNYRRAIELSPNDAKTHHWYAEFLSMQGQFSQSIEEYARAQELDPLSLPIQTDRALMFYYKRQYVRASSLLEEVKARDPDYRRTYEFLAWVLREQGLFAESTYAMDKIYEMDSQGENGKATADYYKKFNSQLRTAASMNGAPGFWRTMADSDLTINTGPYSKAVAYAKIGEKDEAFKFLEKAFEQHYSGLVWLKVDPALEDLRQDPRYDDMLKRVGLK